MTVAGGLSGDGVYSVCYRDSGDYSAVTVGSLENLAAPSQMVVTPSVVGRGVPVDLSFEQVQPLFYAPYTMVSCLGGRKREGGRGKGGCGGRVGVPGCGCGDFFVRGFVY